MKKNTAPKDTTNYADRFMDISIGATIPEVADAIFDAERVFSVDLIAANPDIADEITGGGGWEVVIVAYRDNDGTTYYVPFEDDHGDLFHLWSENEYLVFNHFYKDLAAARQVAGEMIMDWKRNWDLA